MYLLIFTCFTVARISYLDVSLSVSDDAVQQIQLLQVLSADSSPIAQRTMVKHYAKIIQRESFRSQLLRDSFLLIQNVPIEARLLMLKKWSRVGLRESFELFYQTRDSWWHSEVARSRLIQVVNARYAQFRYSDYRQVPTEELYQYCDMLLCYAYCGYQTSAIGLYQVLGDKRVVRDFTHHPLIGHNLPMPSRVCDHALMGLFILYQVDVAMVSKRYGYPLMFDERPQSPQAQVEQAFDAMIRDWPRIRQRFSHKP